MVWRCWNVTSFSAKCLLYSSIIGISENRTFSRGNMVWGHPAAQIPTGHARLQDLCSPDARVSCQAPGAGPPNLSLHLLPVDFGDLSCHLSSKNSRPGGLASPTLVALSLFTGVISERCLAGACCVKAGFALMPTSFFFSLCLFFGEGVSLWVNSDKCVNKNFCSVCFLVWYSVSSVGQGFLNLHPWPLSRASHNISFLKSAGAYTQQCSH